MEVKNDLMGRLKKFCDDVVKFNDGSINCEFNGVKFQILRNETKKNGRYMVIDRTHNTMNHYNLITEVLHAVRPKKERLDTLPPYLEGEMIVLYQSSQAYHYIYLYDERDAIRLTDAINKRVKSRQADWYYNIIQKVYIIECLKKEVLENERN